MSTEAWNTSIFQVQVLTVQRRILKALFSKNSEIQFLYKFTKYHCNVLSLTCKTTMSAHLFHGDSSEAMLHNMSNSSGAVTGFNVYNHLQSRDVVSDEFFAITHFGCTEQLQCRLRSFIPTSWKVEIFQVQVSVGWSSHKVHISQSWPWAMLAVLQGQVPVIKVHN